MKVIQFLGLAFLLIGLGACGGPGEQPPDEVEAQPAQVFSEDFESGEVEQLTQESPDGEVDESGTKLDFEDETPDS
ncbi:MAG: hypothetical protein K8R59_03515 [Thermoanaerobaculales bacterium]|nr:hypothetical protein [Thermoanaerobaculales bacterium]